MNPRPVIHLGSKFASLGNGRGTKLYFLGMIYRSHCTLLIDEQGRLYIRNGELDLLADSFDEGLEMVLLGKRRQR